MNYFSIVLSQLEIFAVYMIIGMAAVKMHILDRGKLSVLSGIVTKILLPLLIFTNTIHGPTREEFLSSTVIIAIGILLFLSLYLLSILLSKAASLKGNRSKVYRACTMFGNCGFMGIPVILALYPDRGGLYMGMYTVADQLMLWTLGVYLASPVEANLSISGNLRKMVNPATMAVLLSVFFVLTGLRLPDFLSDALTKTGSAAPPLSMIYLGGAFCYISIKEYLKKLEIYLMILVKMLLAPLAVYFLLTHIPGLEKSISITLSIICGLPSMSSIAMIAETQHSDSDYAAGMIFLTTISTIITLPIVCALL